MAPTREIQCASGPSAGNAAPWTTAPRPVSRKHTRFFTAVQYCSLLQFQIARVQIATAPSFGMGLRRLILQAHHSGSSAHTLSSRRANALGGSVRSRESGGAVSAARSRAARSRLRWPRCEEVHGRPRREALQALRPQALRPQALGSQALGSQALGSQALGSQVLGSQVLRPQVLQPTMRSYPPRAAAGSSPHKTRRAKFSATRQARQSNLRWSSREICSGRKFEAHGDGLSRKRPPLERDRA
jgi:hypothetical protein